MHTFRLRPHVAAIAALASCSAVIVGCGGDEPGVDNPTMLSGTAAVGAPLAGATITVSDGDEATPDTAPVTAGADGRFSVDVTALKAPLLVKAVRTVDGETVEHFSVLATVAPTVHNTANVTPLTTAVAALIAPGTDPRTLTTASALASSANATSVGNAARLLVNTLSTDSQIASALGTGFDPTTSGFSADGTGIDSVLDRVAVSVSAAGVSLTNLSAPVAGGALPASVMLTAAQVSTPTVVPTMPASAPAGSVPTSAELGTLGAKYQACLALPIASRVAVNADGEVTAVLGACNFAPADWRSNGRTWAQELGQYTFAKDLLSGARVGAGSIALTVAPEAATDAREFENPYCKTSHCVVVRYPVTTASGRVIASDWVLGKVNGQWDFVGNQRPYRLFIEPRLVRKINSNRDGNAAGNNADPYFVKDRFESSLRIIFDLNSPNSENVRAIRVTGPGLPADGVVLFRSQRCGSDDRMAISFQNGQTRVLGNGTTGFQYWTGNGGADFILDAAHLDGTALALPTPVNTATTATFQDFSPVAVANQGTVIAAWSRYKVEVFHFSTLSDTPDEIVHIRVNNAGENAAMGAGKAWPTLDAGFAASHLVPGAADAGAITSVTKTMAWTVPAGSFVTSGYLFGQNFVSATNSQNETATYGVRSRLDFEPTAYGDASGKGTSFASGMSGTSMSTYTQNASTNPNPRCAGTSGVVPLTANINDYREAGLTFRGSDRKLYGAIWYWDN